MRTGFDGDVIIVGGIDEAGKGPVIGPLVVCILWVDSNDQKKLKKMGAKDSKLLSPSARERLYDVIKENSHYSLRIIPAAEIDAYMSAGGKISNLEIEAIAKLIDASPVEKVFIDSLEANEKKFENKVRALLKRKVEVVAKTKGDRKFPVCSAASIMAKVTRDREIDKLKLQFGDFGSGYPADERTIKFLKDWYAKNKFLPVIVRHSWETVKRIKGETSQRKLDL